MYMQLVQKPKCFFLKKVEKISNNSTFTTRLYYKKNTYKPKSLLEKQNHDLYRYATAVINLKSPLCQ